MVVEVDLAAFRAFERAGWEAAGKAARYAAGWGPITSQSVDALLDAAGVGAGKHVLDVASGPGYVAAAAHRRGALVVGIDVAEAMVRLARDLHPELTFRQSEAEELPCAEATFDAVVGNFLVNHLAAPETAVAEARRVLKPGGRAAFTVWDTPDRARFIGVLLDAIATVGAPPPTDLPVGPPIFRFSDNSAFSRLLTGAGLRQSEVRELQYSQRFADADELWNCLVLGSVRLGALVLCQPETTQQLVRQEFEQNLEPYETSDGLVLPVSVKLGVAVKA